MVRGENNVLVSGGGEEVFRKGRMRAAVLNTAGKFEIVEVEKPKPGPYQIRVLVEGSGISNINLEYLQGITNGTETSGQLMYGHEGWGIVDEVGEKVTGFAPGEKVTFISSSTFAEYEIVESGALVKLPPQLRARPLTGAPLAQVINIFKRAEIKKGQTVGIVGMGFMGLVLCQMIKQTGARVIAVSKRAYSLEEAKKNGADEILQLEDEEQVLKAAETITNGKLCDRVIEITGKELPVNVAAALTSPKGKLIIAGYHKNGKRNINLETWNIKGFDVINAFEKDPMLLLEGMKEAVKMVNEGELNPYKLYTHSFPLEEITQAFEMASERPEGFVKGLILF